MNEAIRSCDRLWCRPNDMMQGCFGLSPLTTSGQAYWRWACLWFYKA